MSYSKNKVGDILTDIKTLIDNTLDISAEDIQVVNQYYDRVYDKYFSVYFSESKELFKRLESTNHTITDDELSWILISLPIKLFEVSEELNKFKLLQETMKIRAKEKETEFVKSSGAKTLAQKKDDAYVQINGERLIITIFSSVISRVESEISLSKELIMGAKKIWDARRKADMSMPVKEIDSTDSILRNYSDHTNKTYIHGSEI